MLKTFAKSCLVVAAASVITGCTINIPDITNSYEDGGVAKETKKYKSLSSIFKLPMICKKMLLRSTL